MSAETTPQKTVACSAPKALNQNAFATNQLRDKLNPSLRGVQRRGSPAKVKSCLAAAYNKILWIATGFALAMTDLIFSSLNSYSLQTDCSIIFLAADARGYTQIKPDSVIARAGPVAIQMFLISDVAAQLFILAGLPRLTARNDRFYQRLSACICG